MVITSQVTLGAYVTVESSLRKSGRRVIDLKTVVGIRPYLFNEANWTELSFLKTLWVGILCQHTWWLWLGFTSILNNELLLVSNR